MSQTSNADKLKMLQDFMTQHEMLNENFLKYRDTRDFVQCLQEVPTTPPDDLSSDEEDQLHVEEIFINTTDKIWYATYDEEAHPCMENDLSKVPKVLYEIFDPDTSLLHPTIPTLKDLEFVEFVKFEGELVGDGLTRYVKLYKTK